MAIIFKLKETIKTLVLAPSVATLAFVGTNIVTGIAIKAGALGLTTAGLYPLAVSAMTFAIVIVFVIDDMIDEKPVEKPVQKTE